MTTQTTASCYTIGKNDNDLIDILNPTEQDIDHRDIAQRLSRICRWHGAGRSVYSVAEHSLRCFAMSLRLTSGYSALSCVLHDAHEAYTGDIAGPLRKLWLEDSDRLERICQDLDRVIYNTFDIKQDVQWNHAIDQVLLYCEAFALFPDNTRLKKTLRHIEEIAFDTGKAIGTEGTFKRALPIYISEEIDRIRSGIVDISMFSLHVGDMFFELESRVVCSSRAIREDLERILFLMLRIKDYRKKTESP